MVLKPTRLYAGIGSRDAPQTMLNLATRLAKYLKKENFILRSGGANGMDSAFAAGAGNKAEIFFPTCDMLRKKCKIGQKCFCEIPKEAFNIAEALHPHWDHLSSYVKRLHARNVQIILGENLSEKVEFVVLWSKHGKTRGGTAMGWRLAEELKIPVVDLGSPTAKDKLKFLLDHQQIDG